MLVYRIRTIEDILGVCPQHISLGKDEYLVGEYELQDIRDADIDFEILRVLNF